MVTPSGGTTGSAPVASRMASKDWLLPSAQVSVFVSASSFVTATPLWITGE